MTAGKFQKQLVRKFKTEKTIGIVTQERMQKAYDKAVANEHIDKTPAFIVSQDDGLILLIAFGDENRQIVREDIEGYENEHGDIWHQAREKSFVLNDGTKAYAFELKTEELLEYEEERDIEGYSDAYFGVKEDDGKYSKEDVYGIDQLL